MFSGLLPGMLVKSSVKQVSRVCFLWRGGGGGSYWYGPDQLRALSTMVCFNRIVINCFAPQVNSHGIVVTFLGGFEGCLDLLHLAEHGGNGEVKETYPVKTKV